MVEQEVLTVDSHDDMEPEPMVETEPMGEPEPMGDGPRMGMTRSSLLARAGVVAAGGAALAASPLGLGLARPRAAFAQTPDNEIAPPPPSPSSTRSNRPPIDEHSIQEGGLRE